MKFSRRALLGSAAALPLSGLFNVAEAGSGTAERVIFLYFPDGVPAWSEAGDTSLWHASGSEWDPYLPQVVAPLEDWKDRCLFFRGLSSGGTDNGSHPGGAQKLLTAVDYGNGESIDNYLARTAGYDRAWRHLYLGVQANYNSASGDKHVVYPSAGTTISPQDDPRQAFEDLFGSWTSSGSGDTGGSSSSGDLKVVQSLLEETQALRSQLGGVEKDKLDYHVESLLELEARYSGSSSGGTGSASCEEPGLSFDSSLDLYDPGNFPAIAKAQMDLAILAMECGLTKVATIQMSHHTSELIMSRFPDTDMYDPDYDMRSHQASHYGSSHDWGSREFTAFVQQRVWFVEQLRYLMEQLDARPEGGGTMLDNSVLVLCTEVCDGNTHQHDDLPILLAGGAGGAFSTGRLVDVGYRRHGDLWASVAQAMGQEVWSWGDGSSGSIDLG